MKFSLKVFLSTLILAAAALAACSYLLIDGAFRTALSREERFALEENQLLRFSFLTAAAGVHGDLTDGTARRIAQSLEGDSPLEHRVLRLSNVDGNSIYTSANADIGDFLGSFPEQQAYRLIKSGENWFVHSSCQVATDNRIFYLESFRDSSEVFAQRDSNYRLYRGIACVGLLLFAAVMYMLARFLTAPIQRLSETARGFANGDYSIRAAEKSNDEIGLLTKSFNTMADSLEQKIADMVKAARQKENFIASFAHELKTPLTAVIGYADLLRSRSLDEETRFKAASYIFTEGKRLESLSFKLLELIVLQRQDFPLRSTSAMALIEKVAATATPALSEAGITISWDCTDTMLNLEVDLVETLLLNLCDNARKASTNGGTITISGGFIGDEYCFAVSDKGSGMPAEVIEHATEPFFMADKSRSRAQNGAGLGLALCTEIAKLHGGRLKFESVVGAGTTVRFLLRGGERCEMV